ncbi:retrovirus-related pol polyprotein from transposon TNT 1-94 [Tanacetum coccineum]
MLAPNPSLYYNGRASFVNPMYLKKAQFEKACLYKVPYDKDDLANIFAPNYDETLILEQESRSKLDKDLVKPYDYIHQNSLYEIFTPQTQKSLDQLIDELQSNKTEHSNEYDLLLQECLSKDIFCVALSSMTDIDEYSRMACKYLEKVKECECLEIKLSKQHETISKEDYHKLVKSFCTLEQHSISLKLALQQYKEQLKNDKVWKQQESTSFREINQKYFKIQDLKAQLQDRDIAISELKKLIEKSKGKTVETKFDKPSVVRQTNAIKIVQIFLFIVDSRFTKHMNGNLKLLCNFVEKYMGTGNDLLMGTHGSDLYTIALQESSSPTLVCFLAKASPTQAWLWYRRLSHLNFDTINLLSKNDIVKGLPKLKFVKDQLCSSCELGKEKISSFKSLTITRSKKRLDLLHMDLCGPMWIETINGKKYILIWVLKDDCYKFSSGQALGQEYGNKKDNREESSLTFESERSQLLGMVKDFEKHVYSSSKINMS